MKFLITLTLLTTAAWAAPPKADTKVCQGWVTDYLKVRKGLNTGCVRDADCTQLWPGLCPQGAAYINATADISALQSTQKRIETQCMVPECEPPLYLPLAHCAAGTCKKGRAAPAKNCWDKSIKYSDSYASGSTHAHQTGVTPVIAVGAPAKGTLKLEIRWAGDGTVCGDCTVHISQHNPSMGSPVQASRSLSGHVETLLVPVTRGLYYMNATKAGKQRHFSMKTTLIGVNGKLMQATHHGEGALRICED